MKTILAWAGPTPLADTGIPFPADFARTEHDQIDDPVDDPPEIMLTWSESLLLGVRKMTWSSIWATPST